MLRIYLADGGAEFVVEEHVGYGWFALKRGRAGREHGAATGAATRPVDTLRRV